MVVVYDLSRTIANLILNIEEVFVLLCGGLSLLVLVWVLIYLVIDVRDSFLALRGALPCSGSIDLQGIGLAPTILLI